MNNKNIIVFVHTCKALYEERTKILQETWTKGRPNVVFVTDDPDHNQENFVYLGEYRRGFDPNIIRKVFELYLTKYSDYGWFMLIDDDAYLFIDKLTEYLEYFDERDSYMIGDWLNWIPYVNDLPEIAFYKKLDYNSWFSGGPGIVLSKPGVEDYLRMIYLSDKQGLVDGMKYGYDLWFAYLFYYASDQKSVRRINCPGFHQYGDTEVIAKYPKDSKLLMN
jgi:Fringe-like